MTIAILALQGAFAEHQQMLQRLGVNSVLIRNLNDWNTYIESITSAEGKYQNGGLIIPGGESTAMMRIIKDEALFTPVRDAIMNGLPVFGTCAGLIMLDKKHLNTMDITAKRNAYGRQLGSFHTDGEIKGMGIIPMTFIRAPYIEETGSEVEILSVIDNRIVAAQQGKQLVCAFHPELTTDTTIHEHFTKLIAQ